MAYRQKENTGALFRNKDAKSDKSPSHSGTLNVEGTIFRLSAWVKETKSGEKYFSLAVSMAERQPEQEDRRKQDEADLDSDFVPF